MIPKELLEKYSMGDMEDYESEHTFYQTFLIQTDHIPLKIIEAYITYMVENNVNVGNMKRFFADVEEQYGEVLEARKFAREEINRIESEMATN